MDQISGQDPAVKKQIIIEPSRRWISLQLRALWQYRELLYFLIWRDLKVRYKQTALGIGWIMLHPVISMVIFSFLFGGLLQVHSGGVPYPIFVYSGLLPWNYFANSLTRSSTSLVNNQNLITKVYFPRLVVPIFGVLSGLVDFLVSFIVLIVLMIILKFYPTLYAIFYPGFLLLAIITSLGFGLWLSALNVRYRDVNYITPFLI